MVDLATIQADRIAAVQDGLNSIRAALDSVQAAFAAGYIDTLDNIDVLSSWQIPSAGGGFSPFAALASDFRAALQAQILRINVKVLVPVPPGGNP